MTDYKKPVAIGLTYEDGLALITKFAHVLDNSYSRYTWAVLMEEDDGSHSYWERHGMPCYGEMRPYAQGSSDNGPYEPELMPEEQRKVSKPGDLYCPFPRTGKPVALAVPFGEHSKYTWNELMEQVVLNPEVSPWRNVLKDIVIVRNEKTDNISGLVIKDTNVEPTAMVNLFRKIKGLIGGMGDRYESVLKKHVELSPLEAFVFAGVFNNGYVKNGEYDSLFGMNYSIKRIITGNPVDQTGGTFHQRYAYNRPKCDYVFADPDDSFVKKVKVSNYTAADEKTILDAFLKEARA